MSLRGPFFHEGSSILPDEFSHLEKPTRALLAEYFERPSLQIEVAVAEALVAKHRNAHPQTPSLEELREQELFDEKSPDQHGNLVLTANQGYWAHLVPRASAYFWEQCLADESLPDYLARLHLWLHHTSSLHHAGECLVALKAESRHRFLDAAKDLILRDPDLADPTSELEKLKWESRYAFQEGIPQPIEAYPPQDATHVDRFRWADESERRLGHEIQAQRCRHRIDELVGLIVRYDDAHTGYKDRYQRTRDLLAGLPKRPYLAIILPEMLYRARPDALAWLLLEPSTADLSLLLFDKLSLPTSISSLASSHLSVERRRQDLLDQIWEDAIEIAAFVYVTHSDADAVSKSIFAVIHYLAEQAELQAWRNQEILLLRRQRLGVRLRSVVDRLAGETRFQSDFVRPIVERIGAIACNEKGPPHGPLPNAELRLLLSLLPPSCVCTDP
ncbi:MAG: hypothetical protein ABIP48_23995, partial [Planctomycetota bacterium]